MQQKLRSLAKAIAAEQLGDGSFISLSGPAGTDLAQGSPHKTIFATALVAGLIADAQLPELDETKRRALSFLLSQRSEQWTFGYYERGSEEASARPYPDDWDDTSLALAAIDALDPAALGGTGWAEVTKLLAVTEAREGGPYWTWIVGPEADPAWRDVDLAVNCNIAAMLARAQVELDSLRELVDAAIRENAFSSKYYPNPLMVRYFAGRWYKSPTLAGPLRHDGEPINMALAALIHAAAGETELAAADTARLASRPLADMLAPAPICFDPEQEGIAYVAGCRAATAALCLAALSDTERIASDYLGPFAERVELLVRSLIDRWSPELIPAAKGAVAAMLGADPAHQITTLPIRTLRALGRRAELIDDSQVAGLGAMSVMGWLAFTVYDDFMDGEGRPAMMPLANRAHAQMADLIYGEPGDGTFCDYANAVLDQMAAANAWELSHCRFEYPRELGDCRPDYGNYVTLADRSGGHGLGWAAIWMRLGIGPSGHEFLQMAAFFRHFLIARQLNDEAHDWEDDLRHGHVNAVGAMLVTQLAGPAGADPDSVLGEMRTYFWQVLLPEVCDLIESHLATARAALASCRAVDSPTPLLELLTPIEAATAEARVKRTQTLAFLAQFRQ